MSKIMSRVCIIGLVGLALILATGCTIKYPRGRQLSLVESNGTQERTPVYEAEGYIIARASLHNHTLHSDGRRSAEDLLDMAEKQGMAILAYTDHREGKMCVGKSKLVCLQAGGVEQYGYDAYYEHLRLMQADALERGMIALKGIEVSSPHIYNYGKFPHLVIGGQFKHFTVYAVEDTEIFERMPTNDNITLKPVPIPGDKPYQEFVDYIVENGGIVHAVHVESPQDDWLGPVHVLTPAPIYNIHLKNLTGFSAFPEGRHEKTGGPGGLWDTALLEYQAGMRAQPLWASADADYHGPKGSLATATTLFYMREFTEQEVYKCMREGRMVALQGKAFQDSYVEQWWVSDGVEPGEQVMLGRELVLDGAPRIRFSLDHAVAETRIRLIRNGSVIAEVRGTELDFTDEQQGLCREPAFYRVEVIGPSEGDFDSYEGPLAPDSMLLVNPIFVKFTN